MSQLPADDTRGRNVSDEPYLSSTEMDYLARMNLELLSELWITRDRLAVLEQVLIDNDLMKPTAVDDYVPDADTAANIETLRRVVVENVIGAMFKPDHSVETLKAQGRALAAASQHKKS